MSQDKQAIIRSPYGMPEGVEIEIGESVHYVFDREEIYVNGVRLTPEQVEERKARIADALLAMGAKPLAEYVCRAPEDPEAAKESDMVNALLAEPRPIKFREFT